MTLMDLSTALFAPLSVQAHNYVMYVMPYTIIIASGNGLVKRRTRVALVVSTLTILGSLLLKKRGNSLTFPKSKGAQILNALKLTPQ